MKTVTSCYPIIDLFTLTRLPPASSVRLPKGKRIGSVSALYGRRLTSPVSVIHNGMGLKSQDPIPDINDRASAAHDLAGELGFLTLAEMQITQKQLSDSLPPILGSLALVATYPWALSRFLQCKKVKTRLRCLALRRELCPELR